MTLPSLSQEQLSTILSSSQTYSELYDRLWRCEGEALLLSESNGDPELLVWFYSTFFFSHLLTEEISEARMFTKRIPESVARNTTLQNCFIVLRAVWQKEYDYIYKALRELPWPEALKPLVQRYEVYFQNKTLKELSYTYQAIRPETAASYVGLDSTAAQHGDPDIIQTFTNEAWKWDEGTMLLYPKPVPPQSDGRRLQGLRGVMSLLSAGS